MSPSKREMRDVLRKVYFLIQQGETDQARALIASTIDLYGDARKHRNV